MPLQHRLPINTRQYRTAFSPLNRGYASATAIELRIANEVTKTFSPLNRGYASATSSSSRNQFYHDLSVPSIGAMPLQPYWDTGAYPDDDRLSVPSIGAMPLQRSCDMLLPLAG